MTKMHVDVRVRFTGGVHVTNTIRGVRASSTSGWREAAESFGKKYFGPAYLAVDALDTSGHYWRVYGDPKWYAWCYASGRIDMGAEPPHDDGAQRPGVIVFASGPQRSLRALLDVRARHGQGRSVGLLLVPGVPEAPESGNARVDALIAWVKSNAEVTNNANNSYGVKFSRRRETL